MRVSVEEKKKIRERILVETLDYIKVWGPEAAPVDKIMKKLGLTSGALYSHFKSKDDLMAQVIIRELERITEMHKRRTQKRGDKMMSEFVEYYLQDEHVENVQHGCMFVAFGTDLHRMKSGIREKIEDKVESMFIAMAKGLPKAKSEKARIETVKYVFSCMVGTVILARAIKNERKKKEMIRIAKNNLLKSLNAE